MKLYKKSLIYKIIKSFRIGKKILNDPKYLETISLSKIERNKAPNRTEIINYIISYLNREVFYLEIGVRNPNDNFDHVNSNNKYSVDPGIEFKENPVDFKMTSDVFFELLEKEKVLNKDIRFDVIFIDGLHLAEQVDKDIFNALKFLSKDGFIILHDYNPPTEWHAREDYYYAHTPAGGLWNGTTWKAFLKWRFKKHNSSCCIDTDWGIGIITNHLDLGGNVMEQNIFYEFKPFSENRKKLLNLISFDDFKVRLNYNSKNNRSAKSPDFEEHRTLSSKVLHTFL
jgi:hypothetical protein